jgi:hypothetical protein
MAGPSVETMRCPRAEHIIARRINLLIFERASGQRRKVAEQVEIASDGFIVRAVADADLQADESRYE